MPIRLYIRTNIRKVRHGSCTEAFRSKGADAFTKLRKQTEHALTAARQRPSPFAPPFRFIARETKEIFVTTPHRRVEGPNPRGYSMSPWRPISVNTTHCPEREGRREAEPRLPRARAAALEAIR
ncbi:hypothetical protein EVAR_84939_1 [Eumeta japonica]|uniref:Uncharacterized protein n=1 Tax=Eumeta variegata TaxID=151549 RepID=A0A4C1VHV8_EUMVA|nr:hypothetical protein EVAR_84939_1 [Eumeta japonica]